MTLHRKQSETMYSIVTLTALVLGIYFSGHYAYVLFHGLVEIVSIAIAFAMFVLVWNTRAYLTNNYLRLLGIGYAFSAFIDLLHTFSFQGMTVFTGYGANLAPQLWLAARYLQTVTLVAAPLVITRSINNRVIFGGYAVAVAGLLALVYSGYFPDCIIAGQGLTPFKKGSEYVISGLLIISLYLLSRKRSHFSDRIYWLLVASVSCTIFSELMFTTFVSMYDVTNKLGHIAKLVAFYLVYRSILVTGLKEPFEVVFRTLKQTEQELRNHQETMENLVRERTASLEAEVAERRRAEEALLESETRYRANVTLLRSVMESSSDMILFALDRNYRYLVFNTKHKEVIKAIWGRDIAVGMDMLEIIGTSADRETARKCFDRTLAGEHFVSENAYGDEQLAREYWQTFYSPIHSDAGGIIGLTCFVLNITERKQTEQQIKLLNHALDHVSEAAYLITEDDRFVYVNKEACRFLGYSRNELLCMGVNGINPDLTPDTWRDHWRELKANGTLMFEGRHKTRQGDIFAVEVNANFFQYNDIGYNLALCRDITERKRMEATLRFIVQRGWVGTVDNFLTALAGHIGKELGVDYVVIGRLDYNDHDMAETVALYAKGDIIPNMRYSLTDTPCNDVMGKKLCFYREGLQALFPADTLLVEMGAESYAGIPLWDLAGQPLGLIAVMDGKPFYDEKGLTHILQLVATSAAAALEREQSDTLLRRRELEFRTLALNSPDNIARYDTGCRANYYNPRLCRTLHLSVSPLGKTPMELHPGGEFREYQERIALVLATGEEAAIDLVLPDTGEGEQYHNVRFVAEREPDGKITGVLAIGRNITQRVRAEEEFKTLNERFTLATNAAHLGVWDWNIVKNELLWDDGMYTLYGIRREDFCGAYEAWLQGVHPDDRVASNDISERARLGEREYNTAFRVVWPDGSVHHLRAYGQVVRDPSGTAIRMTGINVDVTAQKLAEDEISRLKNYLANIIDSMPSMLVGLDREGGITQWNRRAEDITGIPTVSAIGRPVARVLPEFAPWIEALRSETGQGRLAVMEKVLQERQGERRFYDLMLYPLTANGVQGLVLRIEDVTERVRIQELMIQTEKMMSVGGLAAGMAHEINNPLGIITQAIHNIERRTSPELAANREAAVEAGIDLDALADYFNRRRIPEFMASISEAASRASKIIANMLRFSRRAETTMTTASPAAIMEQALELAANDYDLKKKYDFRSIEIVLEYQTEMPAVPMVATELEQVLLNLLKNAAQAMKENPSGRKPRLVLRIRREDRYAVIEVEDNGPGMTEEVRHRVFEPFFTTKEPGIGTGLGLSVSYMIITRNHKGLMEVETVAGGGARFTIRLPLLNGEE